MNTTSIQAFFNQVYDVKFSKHTPLVVVLLSMIYTVYRSEDYLSRVFNLPWYVTGPTAIFIELLVLAASASVFIALRNTYMAELKDTDAARSRYGVYIGMSALGLSFLALLFVAGADAWEVTHKLVPSFIMVLVQGSQMLFMIMFIIAADLDEREKLRDDLIDYQANRCPYCKRPISANNRARHMDSCPLKP